MIPDTKNRIDADAIAEVKRLKDSLGKEVTPPQKQCILYVRNKDGQLVVDRKVDVSPSFSAQRCQELKNLLGADYAELGYKPKDEPAKSERRRDGPKP